MEFKDILKYLREYIGFNQSELARELGLRQYINIQVLKGSGGSAGMYGAGGDPGTPSKTITGTIKYVNKGSNGSSGTKGGVR